MYVFLVTNHANNVTERKSIIVYLAIIIKLNIDISKKNIFRPQLTLVILNIVWQNVHMDMNLKL